MGLATLLNTSFFTAIPLKPRWSDVKRVLFSSDNGNKNPDREKVGQVYLIGAGPGDAELLTLKAYRLIQQADVVLYDWLVDPSVLAMIPPQVQRIFVGKKCGRHSMQQKDICELMTELALSGKQLVRLKGGDPAIFARAAEECAQLQQHGIPFALVPGITAASGASAYAGIPLTHRDCAQSVRFITAHLKSAEDEPNWPELVQACQQKQGETLVFYMGLGRLQCITDRLTTHGLSPNTAIAVVDQATTRQQACCTGTLNSIFQKVQDAAFQGPAIIIVGEVVNKRYQLTPELLHPSKVLSANV